MRGFQPTSGTDLHSAAAPSPDLAHCISQDRLLLYLDGKLSATDDSALEAHPEQCPHCSRLLNRLSNPQLRDLPNVPEFEITGVIAQGGMGTIYHAYDQVLHRDVAIKMLKGTFSNDEALRERFV